MINLTNYLEGIEFSSFNYWFFRINLDTFKVLRLEEGEEPKYIGTLKEGVDSDDNQFIGKDINTSIDSDEISAVLNDFSRYSRRPEYLLGCNLSHGHVFCGDLYDRLLIGCHLVRSFRRNGKNPDDNLKAVHSAIDWLTTTDFYRAPASTRYHDKLAGGLVIHSLNVVENIVHMKSLPVFHSVRMEDAILVALVHDWCKIGLYESYERNVKNASGNWVKQQDFKYRDRSLTCLGHGVSSMFLAQKFFNLTVDQAVALRWHMGFCRVADSDMNELQQANEVYPLVHMLQFADQLSITDYFYGGHSNEEVK